jgi:FAD/FMN-containing dehydrogenase
MDDEGEAPVKADYGDNYDRLAGLKKKYDPMNFFHENQNVRPAP